MEFVPIYNGQRCTCSYCHHKPVETQLRLGVPALMDTPTLIYWIDQQLADAVAL